jgi:hypothetical protein
MRFGLVGLDSPIYSAATRKEVRRALKRVGFSGDSMKVKLRTMERKVPSAKYVFDADEMPASPQLGCSPPQTPEALRAIQSATEKAVRTYAKGNNFAIPKAAYVIAVSKR